MKKTIMTTALAVAFGAAPIVSNAAITVLRLDDTVGGFTTSTAPTLNNGNAAGGNDNQWGYSDVNNQALTGTGDTANLSGEVWVSRVDLGENTPELTTTISGLDAGTTYDIYGYYVTSSGPSDNWAIQLKLGDDVSYATYDHSDGVVEHNDSPTFLRRVYLGQVSGDTTAIVNIDDAAAGSGVRSFIKGVGIEAIPEPSTTALLGLGGLALILRRRK